MRDLFMRIEN